MSESSHPPQPAKKKPSLIIIVGGGIIALCTLMVLFVGGPKDCDGAGKHYGELLHAQLPNESEATVQRMAAEFARSCRDAHWNEKHIACLYGATSIDEIDKCGLGAD